MRRKTKLTEEQAENLKQQKRQRKVQKELRWEKLDNTAHLFPVIAGEQMTNVYRISVTLKELVDPDILQQALDTLLPHFDGFNLRMRSGFFWNYLEENGKPAPRVILEEKYPCRFIRSNKTNSYLFRVSYYQYRINLEVFHVLTDGMGGFNFVKELTYQYLRLKHPEILDHTEDYLSSGTWLSREDSFLKNFKKPQKRLYKTQKAYIVRGEKLRNGELGVMHGYVNVPELKKVCKSYDASINEYLVSTFIWSIYKECMHVTASKKPIRIAVPVNLRPYFNSTTTKNFFVMTSAEFHPESNEQEFSDVLKSVKESLREQMNAEHLEQIFSYNVANQMNRLLRLVPLPLKGLAMRYVYMQSANANTSTITNVGNIVIDDIYKPYIDSFHAFLTISTCQHIKGTVLSYDDKLTFTFSYNLIDPSIQRRFFRKLADDGLHIEIESNGVHYV